MTTTPGAQQNFANTLLAVAKLDEQAANDKVLRAYRREQTQKSLMAVEAAREKQMTQREADEASSIFGGDALTATGTIKPEARGYLMQAGMPQLFGPRTTTITEPPPSVTEPGAAPEAPTVTMNPPGPSSLGELRSGTRNLATASGLGLYQNLVQGAGPGEPGYEFIKNQPFAPTSEGVYKFVKERQEGEQRRAGALHTYAQTAGEEARTVETGVKTEREKVALKYDAPIKEAELRLKDLQGQVERGKLEMQPTERWKMEQDIKRTGEEIKRLKREEAHYYQGQKLIGDISKMTPGTPEHTQALTKLALHNNHNPMAIISAGIDAQNIYANLNAKVLEASANIPALAASTDPAKQEQAQTLVAVHNNNAIAMGRILEASPGYNGQPVAVQIKSFAPGAPGTIYGQYAGKTGTAETDPGMGQAFQSGALLDGAVANKPVSIGPGFNPQTGRYENSRVLTPGQALAAHVSLKHSYLKNDLQGQADAINNSSAPPDVKADALNQITKPNQLTKNVTVETPPTTRGAEAPGLSVTGTAASAGGAAIKGLGKLAPYSPMNIGTGGRLRSVQEQGRE